MCVRTHQPPLTPLFAYRPRAAASSPVPAVAAASPDSDTVHVGVPPPPAVVPAVVLGPRTTERGILFRDPDFRDNTRLFAWILQADEDHHPSTHQLVPFNVVVEARVPSFVERFPQMFLCTYCPDNIRPEFRLCTYVHSSRIAFVHDDDRGDLHAAFAPLEDPASWGTAAAPDFALPPPCGPLPYVEWVIHDDRIRIAFVVYRSHTGERTYVTTPGDSQFQVGPRAPSAPALEFHRAKVGDNPLATPPNGFRARDCVLRPTDWVEPAGYYGVYPVTRDINGNLVYAATGQRVDPELDVDHRQHISELVAFAKGPTSKATVVEAAVFKQEHTFSADIPAAAPSSPTADSFLPTAPLSASLAPDTGFPRALAPSGGARPPPAAHFPTAKAVPTQARFCSIVNSPVQVAATQPSLAIMSTAATSRADAVFARTLQTLTPAPRTEQFLARVKDLAAFCELEYPRRAEPGKLQRILHACAVELKVEYSVDTPLATILQRCEATLGFRVDHGTGPATLASRSPSRTLASPLPGAYSHPASNVRTSYSSSRTHRSTRGRGGRSPRRGR